MRGGGSTLRPLLYSYNIHVTFDTFAEHSPQVVLPLVREIFFLSADPRNVSEDPVKNEAFFEKWAGYYFKNYPDKILLCWGHQKLLAYLMYAPDSKKALEHYRTRVPSYAVFEDLFAEFPAHLHMNAHPDARGKGMGSQLIDELVSRLKKENIGGVHLVTSPAQRNAHFYRKNGFTHEVLREWKGYPLLFMGRKI